MTEKYDLTLKIHRYDPNDKRSWIQKYSIKAEGIQRFVDLFRRINEEQDPSFSWNSSCEHGQCGTCSIKVNGKPLLACEQLVENAVKTFKTTEFVIEPLGAASKVRDLIFDFDEAYEKVNHAKPYVIQPSALSTNETIHSITPAQMDLYLNATRCINCFCCVSVCFSANGRFLGPNAVMSAVVRLMDPREDSDKERLDIIYGDQGVERCHSAMSCSHVCPKEIDVAHYIALAKQGKLSIDTES
ncbi:MAG: 2Fe-2S iron-sulfur cluster-binding protein [Desulfarculaceae bacterium]|jgi:succinate dehydrogenase / fumarate reductase iron-sulfur subunit